MYRGLLPVLIASLSHMSSLVGGWLKQIVKTGSSISSGSKNDFPFKESSNSPNAFTWGPFKITQGTKTGLPSQDSQYAQVCIWRASSSDPTAQRILKQMKTLKHPSMLQPLALKEGEELLIATEWVEPLRDWQHRLDPQWQSWASWQLKGVLEWLSNSVSNDERSVFVTRSGECRLVLLVDPEGYI